MVYFLGQQEGMFVCVLERVVYYVDIDINQSDFLKT